MPTLTDLEERLRDPRVNLSEVIAPILAARSRLQHELTQQHKSQEYQQLTLLLKAILQAEDILKVIYFRYQKPNNL